MTECNSQTVNVTLITLSVNYWEKEGSRVLRVVLRGVSEATLMANIGAAPPLKTELCRGVIEIL